MIPEENPEERYCDLIEENLPLDHPYFLYLSEMNQAEAFIGLSISSGSRVQELRKILDMFDTLMNNLSDPDSKLADPDRKMLNHAEESWTDAKEKLSTGNERTAYLMVASSHMFSALAYLERTRKDSRFSSLVTDYLLKYLGKLAIYVYREAMGHVLL